MSTSSTPQPPFHAKLDYFSSPFLNRIPSTIMDWSAPASEFDPPSLLYTIRRAPIKTILLVFDYALDLLQPNSSPPATPIRLVCISDTHDLTAPIPDGDVLIHAGDLTNDGTTTQLQTQIDWLDSHPHAHKIVIAGNHDTYLDPRTRPSLAPHHRSTPLDWKSLTYLQHASTTLHFPSTNRHLHIHGAPQIPACGDPSVFAFQYPRGRDAWSHTLSADLDVLVTHTPPKHHLDLFPASLGCEHLLAELWRARPRVHVFGHVHAGRSDWSGRWRNGRQVLRWDARQSALERALRRPEGFVRALLDPWAWLDVGRWVGAAVAAVLWDRVWSGDGSRRTTTLVHASLMYNNTGQLRNPPQVVDV